MYYQILLNLVKFLGKKIKVDLQFYRIHKLWEIVYLKVFKQIFHIKTNK